MPSFIEDTKRASWTSRLTAVIDHPKEQLSSEETRKWLASSFDELTRPINMFELKREDGRIPAPLIVGALQTYGHEWSKMFRTLGELSQKLLKSSYKLRRGELAELKKFARLMRKYLLNRIDQRPL